MRVRGSDVETVAAAAAFPPTARLGWAAAAFLLKGGGFPAGKYSTGFASMKPYWAVNAARAISALLFAAGAAASLSGAAAAAARSSSGVDSHPCTMMGPSNCVGCHIEGQFSRQLACG